MAEFVIEYLESNTTNVWKDFFFESKKKIFNGARFNEKLNQLVIPLKKINRKQLNIIALQVYAVTFDERKSTPAVIYLKNDGK